MKDESGVTFSHTGLLHIIADLGFSEDSRKERERDNEAPKEEKSVESCCARPQERKERRKEASL